MRETANDRTIVKLVYDYRILSQNQLERLMDRKSSTVQRLLRRLYNHRYVERVFLPVSTFGSSPALYILDKQGTELLQRMGIEDFTGVPSKNISSMYLEHTQAINEFRIAISQAVGENGWAIEQWLTENEIKADYDRVRVPGKKRPVALVPDSYCCVQLGEQRRSRFFLELDRGKMTISRFTDKVEAYVAYYKSGLFTKRFDAQGFRVLTVVDDVGTGRVENLQAATAKIPGIGNRFWFVHLSEITPTNILFDPIWQVAGRDEPLGLFETH